MVVLLWWQLLHTGRLSFQLFEDRAPLYALSLAHMLGSPQGMPGLANICSAWQLAVAAFSLTAACIAGLFEKEQIGPSGSSSAPGGLLPIGLASDPCPPAAPLPHGRPLSPHLQAAPTPLPLRHYPPPPFPPLAFPILRPLLS